MTVILLPAYNEAPVIGAVIRDLQHNGFDRIIVIDDGSTDGSGHAAAAAGAYVITHRFNRGKGAAVKTGFVAAGLFNADIIVTMDADGQHEARDIASLVEPIASGRFAVALGTRRWHSAGIPTRKIISNKIANAATWLLASLWVADSQSGFRAYSRRALEIIDPQADFYDYDSEIIREIRRLHLRFIEVPITVRYTLYSQSKTTRQSFRSGIKTAYRLMWHLIA